MFKIISRASSANIGAGFDCLGICLSIENTFIFSEYENAVIINNHADTLRNKNNLIVKSYYKACEVMGIKPGSGLKLDVKTVVPLSRGLGSSATCITAGVTAAFLFGGFELDKNDIFDLAAQIEGHPDNVAPNIFGSGTLAYTYKDRFKYLTFSIDPKYFFIAMIPDFKLSTQRSREAVPKYYSREDAVFNMTRTAMTMHALQNGDSELLAEALDDRMHQKYRAPLIKGYENVVRTSKAVGAIGTFISGAGPTIMAVADNKDVYKRLQSSFSQSKLNWQVELLSVNTEGIECFRMK